MHHFSNNISNWVSKFYNLIPQGKVLDLACGNGRHSLMLADAGYKVIAVDRNEDALKSIKKHKNITKLNLDLEDQKSLTNVNWPLKEKTYKGIVVTNYLHRPLISEVINSLDFEGILIYETFGKGNSIFGKPSNSNYLLDKAELLSYFNKPNYWILAYENGFISYPNKAIVQRICVKLIEDKKLNFETNPNLVNLFKI